MNARQIKTLKEGGIGVIKTDTILGIVGSAFKKSTVERIYEIKGRKKDKPFIILLKDTEDLKKFGIKISPKTKKILSLYWPLNGKFPYKKRKYSIVLPCPTKKWSFLHRGKKSLAFRVPVKKSLIDLLKKTGPLVAPSANPQNKKPAMNLRQAKRYFGNQVDFYSLPSRETRKNPRPSTLIKIEKGRVVTLRE